MFHVCQESHEVPEPIQHVDIDDDMSLKCKGQNAHDAAREYDHLCGVGGQEHDHLCANSGNGRHGGGIGKGNGSPPLSDEEEDWEMLMSGNYDE